jgi:uncharacterized protein (TIGR00251 family)
MSNVSMVEYDGLIGKNSEGVTINLYVTPEAKRNVFPCGYDEWRNTIQMKVCSPAKDNKANLEVLKTVADFFDRSIKDVFIISGEKNKEKKVLIKKMSTGDVISKLQESFNGL